MNILVLTDFSQTSKRGLEYTLEFLVNNTTESITLAHVVKSNQFSLSAMSSFPPFVASVKNILGTTIKFEVLTGDLYKAIGEYVRLNKFNLVIFSSRGAHGLQKIVGSHAVKLVHHITCPVIVVQQQIRKDPDGIKEIALPLTLAQEDKVILPYVIKLARLMGAMVEIIYQVKSDEFLHAQAIRNLRFTKKKLKSAGIEYNVNEVPNIESFSDKVIQIAESKSCDLIATVNHHEDGIKNIFGWGFDQNMLENNANIPVLTMNVKPVGTVNDIFMTTV